MPDDLLLAFLVIGLLVVCFFAGGGVVLLFALLYESCFAIASRYRARKSASRRIPHGLH